MLEPPNLVIAELVTFLQNTYGFLIDEITFLPIGADPDTAVYRVVVQDATARFLKLRRGMFSTATVTIPHWLAQSGMTQFIPPILTLSGGFWASWTPYTVILFRFVEGRSGWDVALSHEQWQAFGRGLRALHTATLPAALLESLPRETYSAQWRQQLAGFLQQIEAGQVLNEPIAQHYAALLRTHGTTIRQMIARAMHLATDMATRQLPFCICHGDIHAGNLLITPNDDLYLVDWDTLLLAPKERDLMFIGGGIGGIWNTAAESAEFFQGYGPCAIDLMALSYYRYERIVQDLAVVCEQLLTTAAGGDDRALSLRQIASQFDAEDVVAIAFATDHAFLRQE